MWVPNFVLVGSKKKSAALPSRQRLVRIEDSLTLCKMKTPLEESFKLKLTLKDVSQLKRQINFCKTIVHFRTIQSCWRLMPATSWAHKETKFYQHYPVWPCGQRDPFIPNQCGTLTDTLTKEIKRFNGISRVCKLSWPDCFNLRKSSPRMRISANSDHDWVHRLLKFIACCSLGNGLLQQRDQLLHTLQHFTSNDQKLWLPWGSHWDIRRLVGRLVATKYWCIAVNLAVQLKQKFLASIFLFFPFPSFRFPFSFFLLA